MNQIIGLTNIHSEIQTAFSNFEQRNADNNDNALYAVRQESFKSFERSGLPTTKNEEYKYTPISKALEKNFNFNPSFSDRPNNDWLISTNFIFSFINVRKETASSGF